MNNLEKRLLKIGIISLILKLLFIPFSAPLLLIAFSMLSFIYLFFSTALFSDITLKEIFKKEKLTPIDRSKITFTAFVGIFLALAAAGIICKFLIWPGATFLLLNAVIGMSMLTIFGIIKYAQSKEKLPKKVISRIALIGGISFILLALPEPVWISIRFRAFPDYVEAYKNAYENPDNKELQKKLFEEYRKMRN